jgi:hypothetical protein
MDKGFWIFTGSNICNPVRIVRGFPHKVNEKMCAKRLRSIFERNASVICRTDDWRCAATLPFASLTSRGPFRRLLCYD